MIVPIKKTVFAVGVVVVSGGALITLAHSQSNSSNRNDIGNKDEPGVSNVQGVVENPPVDVKIDGQKVPLNSGSTSVETNSGRATINASANRVEVNHQTTSNTPGSVDVNVTTHSTGNDDSKTRVRSSTRSSSESSSSSRVEVSSDGEGTVNIQQR